MDELEAVPGLEEGIALISRLKTVWENTLQQKDEELNDLKTKLDISKAELHGLQHENNVLRNQFIAILQSNVAPDSHRRDAVPIAEHQKLAGLVNSLQDQLLEAVRRQKVDATVRGMLFQKAIRGKETARDWMDYCESLKEKRKNPNSSVVLKQPDPPSDDEVDGEGNPILPTSTALARKRKGRDLPRSEALDFSTPKPHVPRFIDDDEPVMISERQAKRLRVEVRYPTPMTAPASSRAAGRRLETWDLDETSGVKVVTPRKNVKKLRAVAQKAQAAVRHDRSQSEPVDLAEPAFQQPQQDKHSQSEPVTRLATPSDQRQRQYSADLASGSQETAGSETQFPVRIEEPRPVAIKREISLDKRPLSSHALGRLTEDGEDFGDEKTEKRPHSRSKAKTSSKRLSALLDGREDLENIPPQPSPSDVSRLKRMSAATKPSTPAPKVSTPARTVGRDITNTARRQQGPRTRTRLRDLPTEQLYLSDFKINPVANHGLDFAWTDAVYGNERKCFPGCTDARCCGGALRALAATVLPTLTRPPFPADAEDAALTDEEFLVKWHQGGAWDRRRFRALREGERARQLLDARTRLLADRHGKHRAVGQRHVTPPGFWDVGMPDSQEVERMHAEAAKIDRQIVVGRRAEAMRGGRWLFRDE